MKTQYIHKGLRWLLMALLLTAFSGWTASAALIEVNQTIWGMDCAPCAYSMEKALGKLNGVKGVAVSLNNGDAVVKFAPANNVTLAEIQKTVRNSGFTPKGATIKVSGTLQRKDGELRLNIGKESYILKPSDKAKDPWQQIQKTSEGATVTLTGQTTGNHADQIIVLEMKP